MGIQNLLPLLENSTRSCHVSEFKGHTIAIDTYCWLHKGARSCALQLAKGEQTNLYATYCMKLVRMLLAHDIKPIMVFDGRHLPAKQMTEEKRRESKKLARQQGVELLRLGQINEACKFFKQCVDVTPAMALLVIRECRKLNVDCIVAPYESDAQLAFFSLFGVVDCVISEDSDLLLFGCKKVLYKMDATGLGQLVDSDLLHLSMKLRPQQYSLDKFRYMCILAGCDYVESLPGIGLKKALKFISMTAEDNPEIFLDKVPKYLNLRHLMVDDNYKKNFLIANATFKHQVIFDPFQRRLKPLQPIDCNIEYCKNSGTMFDVKDAFQLALGNLDPLTMEQIDNWKPSENNLPTHSIWSDNYTPRPITQEKRSGPVPKVKTSSKEEVDKAKLQHDEKINRELEFYRKNVSCKESPSTSRAPSTAEAIWLLNTFAETKSFVKKKISHFGLTNKTAEETLIKSQFFAYSNIDISQEDTKSKTDLNEPKEVLPTPDDEIDVQTSPILHETSLSSSVKDTNFLNWCFTKPLPNCFDSLPPNESTGTSNTDEDSLSEFPMVECECILVESDGKLNLSPGSPTLFSVENIFEESCAKKRKLEPELPPKKKAKKQVTIQEMFKKMRSK